MCLAQGPQCSDADEARTCGPSVSSQALCHCAPYGAVTKWNRDRSPTGQFTDTHFEDSSPTELKTVHRQN